MQFFARDIEDYPELTYLALIGIFEEGLAEELAQRFQRIDTASPETEVVALDIRGVNKVNANPRDVLSEAREAAEDLGWALYVCNIPRKFQNKFTDLEVVETCENREELIKRLKQEESESATGEEAPDPLSVGIRTIEGVRLFDGEIVAKDGESLVVETGDRNASVLEKPTKKTFEIYFHTDKFQIPPYQTKPQAYEKITGERSRYRLKFEVPDLPEQEAEQLASYFSSS